ncbi:hypothetical protein SKAU_G00300420 [Synaphobranchus kaupii]|uniref:Uncharacterized protein n=1 Tax=Synaphobranchus kaupii TaxID=118154 RepID=A0A9Q1EVK1_SYNKA|nr:hypothetical protein SKAU_G00300420 [Synaphobranchus kaupii]
MRVKREMSPIPGHLPVAPAASQGDSWQSDFGISRQNHIARDFQWPAGIEQAGPQRPEGVSASDWALVSLMLWSRSIADRSCVLVSLAGWSPVPAVLIISVSHQLAQFSRNSSPVPSGEKGELASLSATGRKRNPTVKPSTLLINCKQQVSITTNPFQLNTLSSL